MTDDDPADREIREKLRRHLRRVKQLKRLHARVQDRLGEEIESIEAYMEEYSEACEE